MPIEYLQLGAVGFIFIFFILKFFDYLKSKKTNGNGNGNTATINSILEQVKLTNDNHLHSIEGKIDRCIETMSDLKERLARVETKLNIN